MPPLNRDYAAELNIIARLLRTGRLPVPALASWQLRWRVRWFNATGFGNLDRLIPEIVKAARDAVNRRV